MNCSFKWFVFLFLLEKIYSSYKLQKNVINTSHGQNVRKRNVLKVRTVIGSGEFSSIPNRICSSHRARHVNVSLLMCLALCSLDAKGCTRSQATWALKSFSCGTAVTPHDAFASLIRFFNRLDVVHTQKHFIIVVLFWLGNNMHLKLNLGPLMVYVRGADGPHSCFCLTGRALGREAVLIGSV